MIDVKYALHPQTFRNLHEHRGIVDKHSALRGRLGKVKGEPKDLNVGLAHSYETGRDEGIHEPVEPKGACAVGVDLARLIADDDNFYAVLRLQLGNELQHLWIRSRLRKHEVPKLVPGKWTLLKKDYPTQVFLEGEFAFLVGLEDETVTLIHLRPIQLEVLGGTFACKVVPTVGEQYPAYINKQRRNWERLFHPSAISQICFVKSE